MKRLPVLLHASFLAASLPAATVTSSWIGHAIGDDTDWFDPAAWSNQPAQSGFPANNGTDGFHVSVNFNPDVATQARIIALSTPWSDGSASHDFLELYSLSFFSRVTTIIQSGSASDVRIGGVQISGGTYRITGGLLSSTGITVSGMGDIALDAGTINVSDLGLNAGGEINIGDGTLIAGSITLNGGWFDQNGSGSDVQASGAFTLENNGIGTIKAGKLAVGSLKVTKGYFSQYDPATVNVTGGVSHSEGNFIIYGGSLAGASFTQNGGVFLQSGATSVMSVAGAFALSSGSFSASGGSISAASVSLTGGTLSLPGAILTTGSVFVGTNALLNLSGGTLAPTALTLAGTVVGGSVTTAGAGVVHYTNTGAFDGTQLVGGLVFDQGSTRVKLRNDASFGPYGATLGYSSNLLSFEATTADHDALVSSLINLDVPGVSVAMEGLGGMKLGIAPAGGVRGRGTVYDGGSYTAIFEVYNEGLVSADLAGQSLSLQNTLVNNAAGGVMRAVNGATLLLDPDTSFTNHPGGILSATGGSTLTLQKYWHNQGSVVLADTSVLNLRGNFITTDLGLSGWSRTGGTVNLQGNLDNTGQTLALDAASGHLTLDEGTIKGGSITTTPEGRLLIANKGSNALDAVQFAGHATLDQSYGRLRLRNDAAFGGDVTLAQAGVLLAFEGTAADTTASFSQTLNLDGGSSGISLEGVTPTLTLEASAVLRGRGSIENSRLGGVNGLAQVINQGLVSADLPGQTLLLAPLRFSNEAGGTVRAVNGGLLVVNPTTSFTTPVSTFENQPGGILSATGGSTLTLQKNWHNAGTLVLQDTSILNLLGTFTVADLGLAGWSRGGGTVNLQGTFDNTGTVLPLASTGTLVLDGGTVKGGVVVAAPGARIQPDSLSSNSFDGVTYQGDLVFDQTNQRLRLRNDSTFAGFSATLSGFNCVLAFEGVAADNTAVLASAAVNLDGAGNALSLVGANPFLTIAPDAVVRGQGTVNAGSFVGHTGTPTVANQGLISADVFGQTLAVTVSALANSGVLQAKSGGILSLPAILANQAGGVFRLLGGHVQVTNTVAGHEMGVGPAARLEGFGEVRLNNATTDTLSLDGILDPSPGAGGLVIKGNLVPAATGVLAFDLAGAMQGTGYDFVSEAGNTALNLNGSTLNVTLARGYAPANAQTFTVLTSNQPITGSFGNVATGARLTTSDGHGTFLVTYTGNSVILSDFQPTPQTAFLAWIEQAFPDVTDPAVTGWNADPDGDGAPNWLEFARKGNPASRASTGLAVALMQDVDPAPGAEFTYVLACRAGANFAAQPGGPQATTTEVDAVSYQVEGGADLHSYPLAILHQGPVFVPPAGAGLPDLTDTGWEYHTFYVTPAATGPRVFLRLRADFLP